MDADADRPTEILRVVVAPDRADPASGVLWAAGAVAVEERDAGERTVLVASTASGSAAALADAVTAWALAHDIDVQVGVEEVADDDWLDAWRDHARAWRAGHRLVVAPPWVDVADGRDGDLVLRIDPGRAFGSGSHVSTRLALAALDASLRPGDAVADVGCGSGVLAVAAARLGAARVEAVDVDPAATAATATNARRNGVADLVVVRPGSAPELTTRYDVVVANLLAPVLRSLGAELAQRCAPGGTLVVAGLLTDQVNGVVAATGRREQRRWSEDGWVALALGDGVEAP